MGKNEGFGTRPQLAGSPSIPLPRRDARVLGGLDLSQRS